MSLFLNEFLSFSCDSKVFPILFPEYMRFFLYLTACKSYSRCVNY